MKYPIFRVLVPGGSGGKDLMAIAPLVCAALVGSDSTSRPRATARRGGPDVWTSPMAGNWYRSLFTHPTTIRQNRKPRTRLATETLEDRRAPSRFSVLNTPDDGSSGTLNRAVGQANATAGADRIQFPGFCR